MHFIKGHPIDESALKPRQGEEQRAAIIRKAFLAGGRLVSVPVSEAGRRSDDVLYTQSPRLGSMLPGPHGGGRHAAIEELLQICTDGRNIEEVDYKWYRALATLGLGVERDGKVYDYTSEPYSLCGEYQDRIAA